MFLQTASTIDRTIPVKGSKLSSAEVRGLFDAAGDDIDVLFSRLSGMRTPEMYGAIGDGLSHTAASVIGVSTMAELHAYQGGVFWFADSISNEMDWLAIQAALYAGGRIIGRPGAHYVLNKTLIYVNGSSLPDFMSCKLDFTGMVANSSPTNLVSNGVFASGAGWSNTVLPATAVVFGGGFATFTDPAPGTAPSFGQFGQQITIPAGKWRARADVTVTNGASGGQYGLPYVGMGFFGTGPGTGASTITNSVRRDGSFAGTEEIYFDFEVTVDTVAWLTFQGGNGNFTVTNAQITPFFLNCAVWATADGWQPGMAPNGRWLGGEFLGPNQDSGIACFLVKSFTGLEHQLHLYGADIGGRGTIDIGGPNQGFSGGVVYSDIAFLCSIVGGTIGYCKPGVQFLPGARNAGENMRLDRVTIYNGWTCLDVRGGGEWQLNGVSMDYSARFIQADRGATIRGSAHFEASPAPVDTMFELAGGSTVILPEGELFQGGSSASLAQHYVELRDSNCKLILGSVTAYNMLTASGDMCTGAGVFSVRNFAVRGGNSLLPGMILRNHQMDAFAGNGGLRALDDMGYGAPADGIGFLADLFTDTGTPTSRLVIPGAAQVTRDTGFYRNGAGSLKVERLAAYTQGIGLRVYYPVTEGKIVFDELYYGQPQTIAPFNAGAPSALTNPITTTAGSNVAEFRDDSAQWLNGSGPRPGWQVVIAGAAGVGGVAAGNINGTRTIIARTDWNKWTVALGAAASSSATGGGAGVTVQYKQTSVRIYNLRWWIGSLGVDAYGRQIRQRKLFAGETDFDVSLTAPGWTRNQMATWYSEPVIPADPADQYGTGRAPAWATHMMMQLDCQNIIPAGVSAGLAIPVHFTDFYANVI